MPSPDDASGAARQSPRMDDFDHAPWLMKLLFAAAGLAIMLLASGVIRTDPANFLAPRWVVSAAGLMFLLAAVLMFIGKHRFVHPAIYMFVAATLCSLLAAIGFWVAIWSQGPFRSALSIGAVAMPAHESSGLVPRVLFGAGAVLALVLAAVAWSRWWRAARGLPVDLSR
jgi:hypothetical protein